MFSLVLKMCRRSKDDHRKIYLEDLDSPRREIFICGLRFIVALLVPWQIDSLSARIERPIQLHVLYYVTCTISSRDAESVQYFFYKVVLRLTKLSALKNERLRQALERSNDQGDEIGKILNKLLFYYALQQFLEKRLTVAKYEK